MKRLTVFLVLSWLFVFVPCYATITPAEQVELWEIILELEKINNEQKTTLNEQETTLNQQQETLTQQSETINEQQVIIENLQKDATEQKTLLNEQRKSCRLITLLSSLLSALVFFILGVALF